MNERQIIWQIWDCRDGSVSTGTEEYFTQLRSEGNLPKGAEILHEFSAATPEEAMSIGSLRMGLGPYQPVGDPELCLNGCRAFYYPKGSGECPYCGEVRKTVQLKEFKDFSSVIRKNISFAESNPEALQAFGEVTLCLHESEQTKEYLEELLIKYVDGLEG